MRYDSKGHEMVKEPGQRLLEPLEVDIPCSLQQTFKEQDRGHPVCKNLVPGHLRPGSEQSSTNMERPFGEDRGEVSKHGNKRRGFIGYEG